MKKQIVKIDAAKWFSSRNLRLCSPAARGFLIDLKCLSPGGRLVANGMPLSDDQIASLTGSTIGKVREWLKELAAADAYDVDGDGLYFADMLKGAGFKAQAKVNVAKAKIPAKTYPQIPPPTPLIKAAGPSAPIVSKKMFDQMAENIIEGAKITKEIHALPETNTATPMPPVKPPAKKPAPWYKTPAGWVRKGQEQGLSMQQDEAYEDFQMRVAKRLPDAAHLDYVPASVAKAVRAEIEQGKEAIKAAIPEQFRT